MEVLRKIMYIETKLLSLNIDFSIELYILKIANKCPYYDMLKIILFIIIIINEQY